MIKENGSLRATDILEELGRNGPLSMNDKDARDLAEVLEGEIKYSDFYGKPSALIDDFIVFETRDNSLFYQHPEYDNPNGKRVAEITVSSSGSELVLVNIEKETIEVTFTLFKIGTKEERYIKVSFTRVVNLGSYATVYQATSSSRRKIRIVWSLLTQEKRDENKVRVTIK